MVRMTKNMPPINRPIDGRSFRALLRPIMPEMMPTKANAILRLTKPTKVEKPTCPPWVIPTGVAINSMSKAIPEITTEKIPLLGCLSKDIQTSLWVNYLFYLFTANAWITESCYERQ